MREIMPDAKARAVNWIFRHCMQSAKAYRLMKAGMRL
jgi:hypothetical protein